MTSIENKVYPQGKYPTKISFISNHTKKKVMETNEIMKKKIDIFRKENPGVFIAIPKINETDLEYVCNKCNYVGKMKTFRITGYEDFEYIKNGEIAKGRREYTIPIPSLICCDNCGKHYNNEELANLDHK